MSKETLGQLSDIYDIFFEDRGVLLSTYSAFGFDVCVKVSESAFSDTRQLLLLETYQKCTHSGQIGLIFQSHWRLYY